MCALDSTSHRTTFALTATTRLPAGTNVLVYSGDEDFVCNSLGSSKWLNALLWSKQQAWGG